MTTQQAEETQGTEEALGDEATSATLGLFVQDEWSVAERVTVVLGARATGLELASMLAHFSIIF